MVDVFGEQIKIVIGIGKQETYFAAGSSPTELLTQVIDQNAAQDTPATPVSYTHLTLPTIYSV